MGALHALERLAGVDNYIVADLDVVQRHSAHPGRAVIVVDKKTLSFHLENAARNCLAHPQEDLATARCKFRGAAPLSTVSTTIRQSYPSINRCTIPIVGPPPYVASEGTPASYIPARRPRNLTAMSAQPKGSILSRLPIALLLATTALSPAAALAAPTFGQAGSEPTANDGQRLSGQSQSTQALFTAVWDGQAAQEWVKEHNAALGSQPASAAAAPSPLPTDFSNLAPGPATCPKPGSTATSGISTPKVTASRVATDTTNEQLTKTAVPGTEGRVIKVDIMVLDQASQKLYVADRDLVGVDVFDVSKSPAKYVTTFKTPTQPNGVVIAGNRIVAGLCDSSAVSIDPTTGQIVGTVQTGGEGRSDELDYDPVDNKVYLANSDDGILTVIDMGSFRMIKQFAELGPALEQPRYDTSNGKMYLTAGNGLYEFDPTTDTQINLDSRSMVQGCAGIQINPHTNRGVMSCSGVVTYDFNEGAPIGTIDQACTGDEVAYSAALDIFALPGGSGCHFGPTESFVGGTPIEFITNVPILPGAHSTQISDANKTAYIMGPDGLYSFPVPQR